MNNNIPYIGREEELHKAQEIILSFGTSQFVFISAAGGVGKTRFLQELETANLDKASVVFPSIIDFDDYDNHIPQNIGRKLAAELSPDIFSPYLTALVDYRKLEASGISLERLAEEIQRADNLFIASFNRYTETQRVILRLDTIDSVEPEDESLLRRLVELGKHINNVCFFIAGRNAENVYENFLQAGLLLEEQAFHFIMSPLSFCDSESYLKVKQEQKHITVGEDVKARIIEIANGRPIIYRLSN